MKILPVSVAAEKEKFSVFFIELYTIHLIDRVVRIAACDRDILYEDNVYYNFPIQRGEITTTVDPKINNVELKICDVKQEHILALFQGFDFRGRDVEIHRVIWSSDLDAPVPNSIMPVFSGEIDAPVFDNKEFTATILVHAAKLSGPRRRCQLACNAARFGDQEECGYTKGTASGITQNISGTTIYDTLRTEEDNHWKDGIITIGYEYRKIISSASGELTVDFPFGSDVLGQSYSIEQGCDKTFNRCKEYNNRTNFSGFPSIPWEIVIKT